MLLVMSPLFKFLLFAPALLLASIVQAKPAKKPVPKLSASVAATMPTRVLDIATYRIAPAPGEPQLLVHLWCAPRRNPRGGGGYAPGYYTGEVTREEAGHSSILLSSTFVYDIFVPNGKGGWNYRNSIFHNATSTPHKITVRYLNNQTKNGYIFEISGVEGDGSGYNDLRTLYVFTDSDFYRDDYYPEMEHVLKRDFSDIVVKNVAGSIHYKFDRDARGYLQIIKSESGFDGDTKTSFDIRTLFNWDDEKQNWKAGPEIRIEAKAAS